MGDCKHERWIYVPGSFGIGDGIFLFENTDFLCADCGEWIPLINIDIEKIVNVKHVPKEECRHDIIHYTSGSTYICLRCGQRWPRIPTMLELATNLTKEDIDKRRRQRALEKFRNGECYENLYNNKEVKYENNI